MHTGTPFEDYQANPGAEALEALLSAHQDAVYNVCYQVLRQAQDAQDAAQQVLLNLVGDLPRIEDRDHLRRWIYRASFQVAIDVRRKRKTRMHHEKKAKAVEATPEETIELVHEHVAKLEDDLRALIAEHYFEQKPLAALAGERGCSTAAIWKKLERAREKLRESVSRAGFASAGANLEQLLGAIPPVAAPKGLITKSLLAKAATVSATLTIGGFIMKTKALIVAATFLLVTTGAVATVVIRQREERQRELDQRQQAEARAKAQPRPAVPVYRTVPKETPVPAKAPVPVFVEKFATMGDFMAAFMKAAIIPDQAERWKEYRRIGIHAPDEGFAKAESKVLFKPGTEDHVMFITENVIRAWFTANPKELLDFMLGFPPEAGMSRAEQAMHVLQNLACFEPEAVLAYAKGLSEEDGRTALVAMLTPMTASGARTAAEGALQLPAGEARREALMKALRTWTNSDFRGASAWAEKIPDAEERQSLLGHLVAMGGRQDPKAAAELCQRIFKGKELYSPTVERVVDAWSEADPVAAAAFVLQLPIPEEKGPSPRARMTAEVAKNWAFRDASAALAWAGRLPEGEERSGALTAVGGSLVKSVNSDPREALALVHQLPEKDRKVAMEVIVHAWAEQDPQAAIAISQSFPGGPVAVGSIAYAWSGRDFDAALAWSRSLPEGALRSEAMSMMVFRLESREPERALTMVGEISDPTTRENSLRSIVSAWAGTNHKAALNWIQQANLPEEKKKSLRLAIEDNRK